MALTKEHLAAGDADSCVQAVKDLLNEAIAEGEAVMADENATRDEVMDAAYKLMKAVQALGMKAADKTDLEMAVELAGMIDLEDYVSAGQQEFTDALAEAEKVLADGDAMQGDADDAWNRLVDAMGGLRLKADKAVLEGLLAEAEEMDLSQYTEESAAQFRMAFADVQDPGEGSQGSGDTQDPDAGDQGSGAGVTKGGNVDHNSSAAPVSKAAKTGDETPVAGLLAALALAAVCGAAAVTAVRRKER